MTTLLYLLSYIAILACVYTIFKKTQDYLKKPLHIRWELYPVAHEGKRAAHGGSYYEEADWWKAKPKHSLPHAVLALLEEVLFLHSTFTNNLSLWLCTYPFHLGLYLHIITVGLALLAAFAKLFGFEGGFCLTLITNLGQVFAFVGFISVLGGSLALYHRRRTKKDLRTYSSPEHYFNLGFFIVFSALGLLAWLGNASFFHLVRDFYASLISFSFTPIDSVTFWLFVFVGALLIVYIPCTHMAHFFMKYFLYHDIRWGDEATQFNTKTQEKMAKALNRPVSWSAPHIQGDGKKSWGDVATSAPADKDTRQK